MDFSLLFGLMIGGLFYLVFDWNWLLSYCCFVCIYHSFLLLVGTWCWCFTDCYYLLCDVDCFCLDWFQVYINFKLIVCLLWNKNYCLFFNCLRRVGGLVACFVAGYYCLFVDFSLLPECGGLVRLFVWFFVGFDCWLIVVLWVYIIRFVNSGNF